jgi:hypothetical protein
VNLGRNGITGRIGMGGIDAGGALYTTAKRGIDMAGLSIYGMNRKDEGAAAMQAYLYGDWTAENTSARIAGGLDTLQLVSEGVLGSDGYGLTARNGSGRRILLTDLGNASNNAITLQHEAYRDGAGFNDNYLETRQAALAHTEMTIRMLQDGQQIGINRSLGNDLLAYIGAMGDTNRFNSYVDGTYDSGADYWKLVKKENGEWDWDADGSLDFNFDLNDKEIALAFYNTFGVSPVIDGIVTVSLKDMYGKEAVLARNLGIMAPAGANPFITSGTFSKNISEDMFISKTNGKINESIDRRDAINAYSTATVYLMANGVKYGYGGGITDPETGIVYGGSTVVDCTALISYLTQTSRTSTALFDAHPSFEKAGLAMPGDVLIYNAIDGAGNPDNHAVILLEGGKIAESAFGVGPRIATQKRLEDYYRSEGYTYKLQPYKLKR